MINLDFTTDNPRWGESGIAFTNLFEYAKTLGFYLILDIMTGMGIIQQSLIIVLVFI